MNKFIRKIFYDRYSSIRFGWVVSSILVGVLLFAYSTGMVANKLSVPAEMAKIEQLRQDIQKPNHGDLESLINTAVKINMEIKEAQYYNTQWWSYLVIPNEWDSVKLIEIPNKSEIK
uniref:Uncharacterized protein n=1 Tax=viral metagenome TaxID=1070528 RepID=A0A6M3LIV3_9ZZZZ